MRKFTKSIRFKITQITVLFTLVLSVLLVTISFVFFQNYTRKSVLQATEFNLQLVAGLVRQDVINLSSLANLCASDSHVTDFLGHAQVSRREALDAYNSIRKRASDSRSVSYIQRLIVTDGENRILQTGGSIINFTPITPLNLHTLPLLDQDDRLWNEIVRDPYAYRSTSDCIPLVRPILAPITHNQIGTVYLSVSTEVITDQLSSYQLASGERLTFSMNGGMWSIDGPTFKPVTDSYALKDTLTGIARNSATSITRQIDAQGTLYTVVSCPLDAQGLTLSHWLPEHSFAAQANLLIILLVCGAIIILLLGLSIWFYLNHSIVLPIGALQKKITAIAGGDFSLDPSIEWDNELGDVGHGVNRMSCDIVALMDARVENEKDKQRLEYRMLQNQMNPHFIYNTLNSIKWMATIQNATGIAEMTTAFSRLLKSISKGSDALVPLREEFALLNDYCTIQQYRYGGSITLEIAEISDETLCECLIPRFSLQPLVENAIFHGIEPKGGVGSIWLYIRQNENGDVCITMQDDGVGMSEEAIAQVFAPAADNRDQKFQKIGLRNVHRRIQYAFGEQYGVTIHSEVGNYTRMEVLIPYQTKDRPLQKEGNDEKASDRRR